MTKTLIVTGANTGLGLSIAIAAAQAGFKTYATMRNLDKRTALQTQAAVAGVTTLQLDVEDTASVQACVAEVMARDGHIDAFVANAGMGFARATEQTTEAEIAKVMDVNFMGLVRCVKAVLPHMRAARSGRILAVSSVGGLVGQPFNEVYCASKFAMEGYMESLASYVGPAFGLHFSLLEPGGISSEFVARALKQIEGSGGFLQDEYLPILQKYMSTRQSRSEGVFQTPEDVAAVALKCLTMAKSPIRLRSSTWAENFSNFKTVGDPDGLKQQAAVVTEMLGGF
ncbi:MAG: NAD(P)-dependent dehydrogenase (short-subunit alcohol dehydrogenase family) [Pseudorhodobacter sp.]|jgi:NAD(P)-dependent dehydrogenase (short-subunit alcohol dehydrogenase family)